MLQLNQLTDFMQTSLVERHFTFDEHINFYPVIEELVFYTKNWCEVNAFEKATLSQAMTLLKFGKTFHVQDIQYWKKVRELTEFCLSQNKKVDIDTVFSVATYLR